MTLLPDLFSFAYVPNWYIQLDELAALALPEPWRFRNPAYPTKNPDNPILERYIHSIFKKQVIDYNTAKRLEEPSADYLHVENEFVCFHTGLYTRRYKAVYGCFDRNKRKDSLLDWYFRGFADELAPCLKYVNPLPKKPHYDMAQYGVNYNPELMKRVKILESQKKLVYKPTNSIYQVLSADVANKHGFNTHGVIFDELHTQPNRKLYDVMTQGSGDARMQPLYFLITTAGNDTNSICYEIHQKALDIEAGRKIDPTFYSVIYGADESEDWTDPKVWKKANPSLGITVGIDKVKAACESARQNPGEENSFRQLRLNQWVKQSVRWMPMEKWDACSFPADEEELEGRVCYGGLDLSSTTDITAFCLVFPPRDEDDKYSVLPYFWIPEDSLDLRVRRDHVPYDVWEKQGFLQTTEGNVVHYGYIEKFIERLGERFNIREIAFDRWGAVQMVQNLEGMGFTVVPFGQGFKDMSPPTKELMKLVLEGRIAHGGHPVLRWMMDNIYIRTDPAGNIKADKEKSTEKIDGAIAMIMGLDRAIRCGNDTSTSVYDDRGILFI